MLLALAVLGVVLRLVVIGISHGSNDMGTWDRFAQYIDRNGLWETYRLFEKFNHPPLMGLMALGLKTFSSWSEIPFRICWKVPPLLGDLFAMWLLWRHLAPRDRLWAAGAVALFSCNPVSIAVTAFHGNTDSLVGVFALYAGILHVRGQLLGAGLALAAAVNVKVIALIYVPGYLLLCSGLLVALRFVGGLALGFLPIGIAFLSAPGPFFHNVFAYNSQVYPWGVNAVAMYGYATSADLYRFLTEEYRAVGRPIIVALALALAYGARVRRWDAIRLGAATMGLFLLFTPGFGVQYLVWLVPLLAAASLRHSVWWALFAGSFLVATYHSFLVDEWPLRSRHFLVLREPLLAPDEPMGMLGMLAWIALGRYLYEEAARVVRARAGAAAPADPLGVSEKSHSV